MDDIISIEASIRFRRDNECFPVINRGQLWYAGLTDDEFAELQAWYLAWLDAPYTHVVPDKPAFLGDYE